MTDPASTDPVIRSPSLEEGLPTLNMAVVGLGHWGPNHVRTFSSLPETQVVAVCDKDESRIARVKRIAPHAAALPLERVLDDPAVHAVVVATPASTQMAIVEACLSAGKDVLCEKPLTDSLETSIRLAELAEESGRVLMVGHVFLFNPGIRWLRAYVRSGAMGHIYYAHTQHTNLVPIRSDVNAFWDLASHGISILNYLFDQQPESVSASGSGFLRPHLEDIGFATFRYPGQVMANLHVSWLDPHKVRQITLVGEKTMVTWDDLALARPIAIHDKGADPSPTTEPYYESYGEFQLLLRNGDIHIPHIPLEEPLQLQARHFIEAVRTRSACPADARAAAAVVGALEAIDDSLKRRGEAVGVSSA